MSRIADVHARQILDSRGNPTVEVDVRLESGAFGRAAVPSGASTGAHEAVELRDGGDAYGGKAVTQAVANVERRDRDGGSRARRATTRRALDEPLIELDGTPNKGRLGANAILGVSLAAAKAAAERGAPAALPLSRRRRGARTLPVPMLNVINGGVHAANSIDLQEFMVVPAGAESFAEALRIGAETYHALKTVLHERGLATAVGDEGGFAPDLPSSEAAIEAILEAAERAGHRDRVAIALDPAVDRVLRRRRLPRSKGATLSRPRWSTSTPGSSTRFPIVSIEDGSPRTTGTAGSALTERLGERIQLVGDDLFVTNPERLQRGHRRAASPTRSSSRSTRSGRSPRRSTRCELAQDNGYTAVMSHRSGETEDTTIADLAVALGDGTDQDRRAGAHRPRREVQPAAADRGGARRRRAAYPGWAAFPRATAEPYQTVAACRYARCVVPERRTKIVATLGPSSDSLSSCTRSSEAGMDAARLNLSHGTHEDHAERAGRRARGRARDRPPDRADRRPPGPEAPDRRPRRADRP